MKKREIKSRRGKRPLGVQSGDAARQGHERRKVPDAAAEGEISSRVIDLLLELLPRAYEPGRAKD